MAQQGTITTTCPSCGKSFDVSSDFIGHKGRCENCQTKFIIEESFAQTPPPTAHPVSPPPVLKNSGSSKKFPMIILGLAAVAVAAYFEFNKHPPAESTEAEAQEVSGSIESKQSDSANLPQNPSELEETKTTANQPPKVVQPVEPEVELVESSNKQDEGEVAEPQEKTSKKSSGATAKRSSNTAKKVKLNRLGQSFPIKEKFKSVDIRLHQSIYPNVNQGWVPISKDQAEGAKQWGSYLGPLGVRIRSHVSQLQNRPAFEAIVPECIRTTEGKLGLTAAEVVQIAPGSPAEGYLEIGDFIIGIEGAPLKSGNSYRPGWNFMHKDRRELQLMFGEKIDQAQGRGDIRLTVLRYPEKTITAFTRDLKSSTRRTTTKSISVSPGDQIRLIVDPNGSNEGDQLAWLSPKLLGKGKPLNLSDNAQITPDTATTGWGEVAYNKDLTGKSLGERGDLCACSVHDYFYGSGRLPFLSNIHEGHFQKG